MPRAARTKPKKFSLFPLSLIILLIILVAFWFLLKSNWDGQTRFVLVFPDQGGGVSLVVADPHAKIITTLLIPGSTQVTVAGQLGVWKLSSVHHLGQQENLGGQLMADTITKSLKFPVDAWSEALAAGFVSKHPLPLLKALFLPYSTSLSTKDRLKLALFSLSVKNSNIIKLNLEETGYLDRTRLVSGEEGYLIKNNLPPTLIRLFSISEISQANARVGILNASDNSAIVLIVSKIIEVLGTKVVSIQQAEAQDFECQVSPGRDLTAQKIAQVFHCQLLNEDPPGNLDLLLKLGTRFPKRF